MTSVAGQQYGASGAESGKILKRILKISKSGIERLFDNRVIHRQNRNQLLEVAQDFLGMPGGNLFAQDIEQIRECERRYGQPEVASFSQGEKTGRSSVKRFAPRQQVEHNIRIHKHRLFHRYFSAR